MDTKRLMAQQFELTRAMRAAHHIAREDVLDPALAIKELAQAIASIAIAVDQLVELAVEETKTSA